MMTCVGPVKLAADRAQNKGTKRAALLKWTSAKSVHSRCDGLSVTLSFTELPKTAAAGWRQLWRIVTEAKQQLPPHPKMTSEHCFEDFR